MKGCQCIPPSPCLPCILGSFELGYVGGWKDCYAEADASNPLAFIYTPLPQNRLYNGFVTPYVNHLLWSCPPAAHFHSGRTTFFIFSFFQNAWNPPVPWLCRTLPYTNYTKLQFRVISSVISFVMQSYQGFAGFRQSPGIVLRLRRLPAVCQAAAIPQC